MRYVLVAVFGLWLSACQMPSESVVVGESTAGVSFKLVESGNTASYEVYIDGLLMGNVADFLAGKAILKIVPGSHIIRVTNRGETVLEEKVYVAAGANKVMVVR